MENLVGDPENARDDSQPRTFEVNAPENDENAPWNAGRVILGIPEPHRITLVKRGEKLTPREFALRYGAGNSPSIISHYLQGPQANGNPLLQKNVALMNINAFPFSGRCDDPIIPYFAFVYAHLKCRAAKNTDVSMRMAIAVRAFAPMIPDAKREDEATSRDAVLSAVKTCLPTEAILAEVCRPSADGYTAFKENAEFRALYPDAVDFATWPPTADEIEALTAISAIKIILFMTTCPATSVRNVSINVIANFYCALAKRGGVAYNTAAKITTRLQDELGIPINIDEEACENAFRNFLEGVNETNAAEVLRPIYRMVPDVARLQLIMDKFLFRGLTAMTLIGRAMHRYPNMNWMEVNFLGSNCIHAFAIARCIVRGNPYFGFAKNRGGVRLCPLGSAAYTAIQLLTRLGGENSLSGYGVIDKNIRISGQAHLDQIINEYINHYDDEPEEVEGQPGELRIPRGQWKLEDMPANEVPFFQFASGLTEAIFS